jgi:hypothetical protein
MNRLVPITTLACASLLALPMSPASAHAVAGVRLFPVTLTIDDPGVADEASLPTFTWQRSGANGGLGPTNQYTYGAEYDKRITERLGIVINDSYVVQSTEHDKTRTGFQDIVGTVKFQSYVNGPHEFIVSLGLIREFGRTGTAHIGADEYGNTTPTIYFGKGLGDLPIGMLRPLAITGTGGFSVADRELKASQPPSNLGANATAPITGIAAQQFNNGYSNRWVGGLSLQYSIPYLQSQVKDVGLNGFFGHLIPLVEVAYSSPASSPSNLGTQLVVAPGVIYEGDSYQFGLEALIPANKASGTNVGVIAQFHLFFDDLFPTSLGKPLFDF